MAEQGFYNGGFFVRQVSLQIIYNGSKDKYEVVVLGFTDAMKGVYSDYGSGLATVFFSALKDFLFNIGYSQRDVGNLELMDRLHYWDGSDRDLMYAICESVDSQLKK